ncbi:U-box domain-containing protein 52-like isoform X2 [Vicia villosa]|uniref:U-box domain-containing protein 52-like isoform X2 n=1 Tax=Vicia villosa TaxID=3911 RepID=UPI00273CB7BE|nr:U-box domain-containing protein 52-like isoform X2 [Vicia villosa]
MWLPKNQSDKKDGVNGLIAVAIDKEKGSQNALKWAIDNLLARNATVILIHVKVLASSLSPSPSIFTTSKSTRAAINANGNDSLTISKEPEAHKNIFLPYRVFCTRKDIQCKDVLLEDSDVAKALIEYASQAGIEHLVLGSSAKAGLLKRFKVSDVSGTVAKGAPDFCTVYVIGKGKIQSMRSASRPAPSISPLQVNETSIQDQPDINFASEQSVREQERNSFDASQDGIDLFRSPFTRKGYNTKQYLENSKADGDISFVSSGRSSTDRMLPPLYNSSETGSRISFSSDQDLNYSFESMFQGRKSIDSTNLAEFSSLMFDNERLSSSSSQADDMEAEMRRLKLELKQTMEMYNTACKEALTAQQKAIELQKWKLEEERRLEEARVAEEAALAIAKKEKEKSKAAIEAAEAQKRIAELEAHKRLQAEMKALREAEEKRKVMDALVNVDVRYRKYTIEEIEAATNFFSQSLKIGEGGYGPVFKCLLDHTPVAVKVLRPDAAQGRSQFQREVEVLSCIRHPNMVLLLGACPEYGCLVYEYMSNGSLDDCLFCRGNTPPLSWQLRFKIAAEIGTGLLFLHQTKPEPIVHRDLKPGNILLDRNFVSKISDVGLARLVPPSVADSVTQYRLTATAGTFCYIDPEYQQTGMLGVKSDIYSLGIIFLQILTARSPMGLAHNAQKAIENGTFTDMLDPAITDWPMEAVMSFANIAVNCAELRRKDRPDLGKVVLPELNRLRVLADNSNQNSAPNSPNSTNGSHERQVSLPLDENCPLSPHSEEIRRNTTVGF